jgi:hypothetical protein
LGVLSYYEDIDEDVEDSMEKTSRNVEVAPDKFAILGKVILKTLCLFHAYNEAERKWRYGATTNG